MRVWVKICGQTTAEGVDAAVASGADAVGFVFAPSPRQVTPEQAKALAERIPPTVAKVAVFARPANGDVDAVIDRLAPDLVQVDAGSFLELSGSVRGRTIPVFHQGSDLLDQITRFLDSVSGGYRSSARHLDTLDETRPASGPGGGSPAVMPTILLDGRMSGRGERADWSLAARIARGARVVLAGGLNPGNVGEAIRTVRPYGVDVSSGVESSPGVKDPDRIAAFVSAVRKAEEIL